MQMIADLFGTEFVMRAITEITGERPVILDLGYFKKTLECRYMVNSFRRIKRETLEKVSGLYMEYI